jgi:hypothetical protein
MAVASRAAETRRDGQQRPAAGRLRRAGLLERNVFVICILGVCCLAQAKFVSRTVVQDSWYAVLGGRIVANAGLPHRDTLTVMTLGRSWVDQQWLAHLGLYGLFSAGGWRLAGVATLLVYLAAFVVTAVGARRRGASDRSVAILLAVAFLTGLSNTVIRAQIFSYLLFALVLVLLLADARRPTRRVYLVLPLLVVWANIHGSVVVGAGLVALRGLTIAAGSVRPRRLVWTQFGRAALLVGLPWLCILVSTYGLSLPGYYKSVLDNSALAHSVTEWGPTTLRDEPVFFVLLLFGLWLSGRARTALTPFAQLALWSTAVLGLLAVRNNVWYALAAAAVLPAALDEVWSPGRGRRRKRLNLGLALAGLTVGVLALAQIASHDESWWLRGYPDRALAAVTRAARQDPALRVFANERYADWLLFRDPSLAGRVAYDARFELLPARAFNTVIAFRSEHGVDWQAGVRGYGLLVLDPAGDAEAVALFQRQPGTRVLYRDGDVVVLRRGQPGSRAAAAPARRA